MELFSLLSRRIVPDSSEVRFLHKSRSIFGLLSPWWMGCACNSFYNTQNYFEPTVICEGYKTAPPQKLHFKVASCALAPGVITEVIRGCFSTRVPKIQKRAIYWTLDITHRQPLTRCVLPILNSCILWVSSHFPLVTETHFCDR